MMDTNFFEEFEHFKVADNVCILDSDRLKFPSTGVPKNRCSFKVLKKIKHFIKSSSVRKFGKKLQKPSRKAANYSFTNLSDDFSDSAAININNCESKTQSTGKDNLMLRYESKEASQFSESIIDENTSCCRSSTFINCSEETGHNGFDLNLPEELSMVKRTTPTVLKMPYDLKSKPGSSKPSPSSRSYQKALSMPDELESNLNVGKKTKGLIPKAFMKLKAGILNSRSKKGNKVKKPIGINPPKNFVCKQTYRRVVPLAAENETDVANKNSKSVASKIISSDGSTRAQCYDENKKPLNTYTEQTNLVKSVQLSPDVAPLLDYSYISVDNFYTALEHLYDHMELVRNGIQQLMDHFMEPHPPVNSNGGEDKVAQYQHSIVMLKASIDQLQFAVFKLPPHVTKLNNLLLPSKCSIQEFNAHIQDMAVDFEHAQYFNSDSPMLIMLKMIVVINLMRNVTNRGRRAFHVTLKSGHVSNIELSNAFTLSEEHLRYVKPTFDLLFTRTRGMAELRHLSVVLRNAWEQTMNMDQFQPFIGLYMNMIETLRPLFVVPNDWYVVRVLPETKVMHDFDGFMSEFYRAVTSPNFANENPITFGTVFNVMRSYIEKIIELHVAILRDLKNVSDGLGNVNTSEPNPDVDTEFGSHDYVNLTDQNKHSSLQPI